MQKNYFQLDKVHSITLTYERESGYEWFPEIPAKEKSFMGIKYGMHKAIPAGWSEYEDGIRHDGNYQRLQSSYFDNYSWHRVDEANKKVYNKAHVDIRFSYKEGIGQNFESNEEAQQWVDDLIFTAAPDKKFTVIIKK